MSTEIIILFILVFVLFVAGVWWYIVSLFRESKKKELLEEMDIWLDSYRQRTTGNNRFLIDVNLLQTSFPEYTRKEIIAAWKEVVQMGWVQEDMIDKTWIVKP